MNKKRLKKVLIFGGCLSILFSLLMFFSDIGLFADINTYGGDAYTGIQNAAAYTAYNVKTLSNIVSHGFSAILFICGFIFIGFGMSLNTDDKVIQQVSEPKDEEEQFHESQQEEKSIEIEDK